jgi:hypothetical protein
MTRDSQQEPIDVVYTWVDGSQAEFQEQLQHYRKLEGCDNEECIGENRFYDNDELKFSLRSLERYAPWVRNVYIVTKDQVPRWLVTSHPRLTLVSHKSLFPRADWLPTFNSHAIEWQLPRIPGLARRFIYFNDDMFLGGPIAPSDLLTVSGGQRVYLDIWDIASRPEGGAVTEHAVAFAQALLHARFGTALPLKKIAHVPGLYDQAVLEEIERLWPDEIGKMASHRFRRADDVSLATLYCHYLLEAPRQRGRHEAIRLSSVNPVYRFLMLKASLPRTLGQLLGVVRHHPRFFCVNDDLGSEHRKTNWLIRKAVRTLLSHCFPEASSFEKK